MGTKFWIVSVFFLVTCLCDFHVYSCDTNCADKLVITPPRLVVKYSDPVSASCSVCPNCTYTLFDFENALGKKTKNGNTILWEVGNMTEWNTFAMCFHTDDYNHQCCTELPITVYKPPDIVSFSFVNHTGPMSENRSYTLQCEVQNVAPIENLTVTFYRGRTTRTQRSTQTGEKPVSKTFFHDIVPTKDDNGVQFWCEAKLELGPEGPQPPPVVASQKLIASVDWLPPTTITAPTTTAAPASTTTMTTMTITQSSNASSTTLMNRFIMFFVFLLHVIKSL